MKYCFLIGALLLATIGNSQPYSKQDSLRGSITPERSWWDLTFYDLSVKVDVDQQTISGSNLVRYKVLEENDVMQIDLQLPMEIDKIEQDGKEVAFQRDSNVFYLQLKAKQEIGKEQELKIWFHGKPRTAPRPPWDAGMVWEKDEKGKPFASSVSWGDGSSQWWPCKDHMYDEVDSMKFSMNVRDDLVAVGNGRLIGTETKDDGTKTFHWYVKNPINNYGINFNVGNYVNFKDVFKGENGSLDCSYWVLEHNLKKAKKQFKQAHLTLEAFEHWFGPYPFYEDSYKLVETHYLGMEHQSATAYGNHFQNGYLGRDLSQSGWGDKFDYLIIHESGHEWFACNITYKDMADLWIHESFTTYSEGLYVEYHYGKEAGDAYQRGIRANISNDIPIIGDYDINDLEYSGDNYPKGATILHMLRQIVDDDEKWRMILRGLNEEFYHQTVTTKQIEDYIAKQAGLNLDAFWDQYLRTAQIPAFEYYKVEGGLNYRWTSCIPTFDMTVKVKINGEQQWLNPTSTWQKLDINEENIEVEVDKNFYVPILYSNR